MGLFKRFREERKNSKADLEGFKANLKYGDNPKELYELSRQNYDDYRKNKDLTEDLLRRILNPNETNIMNNWNQMETDDWGVGHDCTESPIGVHVYIHHFGKDNPLRGTKTCLCCDNKL